MEGRQVEIQGFVIGGKGDAGVVTKVDAVGKQGIVGNGRGEGAGVETGAEDELFLNVVGPEKEVLIGLLGGLKLGVEGLEEGGEEA